MADSYFLKVDLAEICIKLRIHFFYFSRYSGLDVW